MKGRSRRSRVRRLRKRISRSRWFIALLSGGSALVMSAVASTLRVEWTRPGDEGASTNGARRRAPTGGPADHAGSGGLKQRSGDDESSPRRGVIYAFWHGRLFLLVPAFRDRGIVIITSMSFAGEVLTQVLERFGYSTVRGSSGRRGTAALIAMKKALSGGIDGGVALDGPSGPERRAKGGALAAAQSSGCSLVPLGVSAAPAWTVPRTWDRFMAPLLFARCAVVEGEPIPAEALSGMSLEELDAAVDAVTDEADRRVGRSVDRSPRNAAREGGGRSDELPKPGAERAEGGP